MWGSVSYHVMKQRAFKVKTAVFEKLQSENEIQMIKIRDHI